MGVVEAASSNVGWAQGAPVPDGASVLVAGKERQDM